MPTIVEYCEVPNFPGYMVGTNGTVYSRWKGSALGRYIGSTPIQMCTNVDIRNSHRITLSGVKERKRFYVHVLVLTVFIGPCPIGMECCHWDGNPSNNWLENLRWDTKSNNTQDRFRHGTDNRGSKSYRAKLDESDIPTIRNLYKQGYTLKFIANRYDVVYGCIWNVIYGKQWQHVKEDK